MGRRKAEKWLTEIKATNLFFGFGFVCLGGGVVFVCSFTLKQFFFIFKKVSKT